MPLGVVIRSGNWGPKTGLFPHSLHLSDPISTPRLPAFSRPLSQVHCRLGRAAAACSCLAPVQPCVSVFAGRRLCLGSWTPEGQEVAGEAIQGLSWNRRVMGSLSQRRLPRAAVFSHHHNWFHPSWICHTPSHPEASVQLSSDPETAFPFLFNHLGLAGSL